MAGPLRFVAALVAALASASAFSCTSSADCEQLGSCDAAGACACLRGFRGASCGELDLEPVASAPAAMLWPTSASNAAQVASSWGFTSLFDEHDGLFHAVVTVACGGSGVVGSGGGNSWLAHLTSSRADGGFEYKGMFAPQTIFGPHLARASDGTFVLVFRVNVLVNATLCAGAGHDPLSNASTLESAFVSDSELVSGDPEAGTSIYVAWASQFAGPWQVQKVNIMGGGEALHKSNPSIVELRSPLEPSQWLMSYRYNPVHGSLNAVALAADFRGPYRDVANITAGAGGDEDPFAFQVPGQDANLAHVIWHNRDFGYHAFGPLDGSSPWRVSPTQAKFFTLNMSVADGSVIALKRRERPELIFRADGSPALLYNGVVGPDGTAWSSVQSVH